uniref:Leucine rich repeat and Ig domain containing 4a n=1 Tax=Lates calcarifer TaxID=8187 RepID=A0A4W6E100_LATCA
MFEGIAVHQRLCWGVLYLLAAGVALKSETRWQCPQSCRCNTELLEVNCSHGQLSTVPTDLSQNVKLLNLTYNTYKNSGQFEVEAFLGLQSLQTLRLARNRLKIIPVRAFAGLPNLQLLDISDNDLVFISHQAFTGLTSLQELHLDGCNLTAVPTEALTELSVLRSLHFRQLGLTTLPNYSFHHLVRLKELVISHCPSLETLSGNSLFGLNLTSLTVRHCNLSAVPYVPLHHLVYLVYLDLSFNPITYIHGNLLGDLPRMAAMR